MADPRNERLRETLDALHAELGRADRIDPALRRELADTMDEIRGVLGSAPADETLADRLREAVMRLETEHPALGETIQRLTKALADLGI
jgi:hypothetical protein